MGSISSSLLFSRLAPLIAFLIILVCAPPDVPSVGRVLSSRLATMGTSRLRHLIDIFPDFLDAEGLSMDNDRE